MDKKIELKATGETITFTNSTAAFAEMLVTLNANGDGPPAHRHVLQTEFFEAIDGRLGVQQTIFPMIAIFGKLFGLVKAKPKTTNF
jgi:hypothetical protein